jgi:hypothetical protein
MAEEPEAETAGSAQPPGPAEPNAPDDGMLVKHAGDPERSDPTEHPEDHLRRDRWWQRPTIRTIRREIEQDRDYLNEWNERENAATRLPDAESVHLGGLVLAEAFTPSTVSVLYDVLRKWPGRNDRRRNEWIAELDRSRSGGGGGWSNVAVVRRPGGFISGDGYNDSDLPDSVMAVWLHLTYLMPSVAVVVATFTFSDEAADVSSILRHNYKAQLRDVRVTVYGKFGRLRARLPWSRPKRHGMSGTPSFAADGKRRTFEQIAQEREAECRRWFTSRFPGRFALAEPSARPVVRLVFTDQEVPFANQNDWFRPIGLDWGPTIYRSVEIPGWALREGQWPYNRRRFILTVAARRRDAAREPTEVGGGEDNWHLNYQFSTYQAPLVARYAAYTLLSLYAERLAKLRDRARTRRRPRRPVREARALDDYLTTDGLDAATITPDVDALTKDLRQFRREVPEYTEDQSGVPDKFKNASPLELVPTLCSALREQAARLATDTEATVGNIRGSAELRQAVANTRLQRTVVVVSLAALIVAVVGIFLGG